MQARALSLGAVVAVLGVTPIPVGTGPRYHPPPRSPAARFVCRRAPLQVGPRVHVEVFARRRVVIVPAAIGLERMHQRLGRVERAGCRDSLWTLDPSGIVDYEGRATLGRLFRVWGQPLARDRVLSFHGPLLVYVDGMRRRGDPRTLRFTPGAEIVLEVGGYVPPHHRFLFPPRRLGPRIHPAKTVRRTSIATTAAAIPQARAASAARRTS